MFITSRNTTGLVKVTDELREELADSLGDSVPVSGFGECNVGSVNSVARLAAMAQREMGTVDVWINNAGYSGTFQAWPLPIPPALPAHNSMQQAPGLDVSCQKILVVLEGFNLL